MIIEIPLPSYLFAALLIVNLLLAAILIFIERKDAQATWAWLLILFFIPLVGFIIYILLGQTLTRRKMFQWEGIKKVGLDHLITEQKDDLLSPTFRFNSTTVDENRDLIYMHLMNNDAILTKQNDVRIFTDGKKKFDQLLSDIKTQRRSYTFNIIFSVMMALVKKSLMP